MSFDTKRLYELLPAVYRIRDKDQGNPLWSLLSVIADQVAVIEEDLAQLYDDQFIETCAEWVIPYIADLIGHPIRHSIAPDCVSLRAEVAKAIAYRRRKGTAATLEQVARDVTGWDAKVVEFFELLGWTQQMNHLRQKQHRPPNLRCWRSLRWLNTPFDTLAHTVDVRAMRTGGGRHNIPNLGIFLWRLKAHKLTDSPASAVKSGYGQELDEHRFRFHPLGFDIQLFTKSVHSDDISGRSGPANVALPVTRPMLRGEQLVHHRNQFHPSTVLYGTGRSLEVSGNEASGIIVSDLSDERDPDGKAIRWKNQDTGKPDKLVLLDPALGRLVFPTAQDPNDPPRVTFHYGFSANMGGGEYPRDVFEHSRRFYQLRADDFTNLAGIAEMLRVAGRPDAEDLETRSLWQSLPSEVQERLSIFNAAASDEELGKNLAEELNKSLGSGVLYETKTKTLTKAVEELKAEKPEGDDLIRLNRMILEEVWVGGLAKNFYRVKASAGGHANLADALRAWEQYQPAQGVIEIADSGTYRAEDIQLTLKERRRLEIRSASGARPTIIFNGEIRIRGAEDSEVTFNGLVIRCQKLGVTGSLRKLVLRHCTLEPAARASLFADLPYAEVGISRSIVGPLEIEKAASLHISDSIVDATRSSQEALGGGNSFEARTRLTIQRSTVLGGVRVHTMELAENSIFDGPVLVANPATGCIRFCYVPLDSGTPVRYKCKPESPKEQAISHPAAGSTTAAGLIQDQKLLRPRFTSKDYRHAAYCQLSARCPSEIRRGAEDNAEMGAFHDLYQPQREQALEARLDKYLPFGLEARTFYLT